MTDRRPLAVVSGAVRELPSGDTVPIAAGGTGSTTASGARTSLGALAEVVEDTTPQLGGDLDCQSYKIKKFKEEVYSLGTSASVTIDPANGSMQISTTTGGLTLALANFAEGQSVTLVATAATSISLTSIYWITPDGAAPTISGSNNTFVIWVLNSRAQIAYVGTDG